jgi:hypothetical protein
MTEPFSDLRQVLRRQAGGDEDRLGDWDDLAVHQSPALLGATWPASPSWAERFYFNLQRPSGELLAIVGGGIYPRRGVAECYLCRLDGDRQHNLRAWAPLAGATESTVEIPGEFTFTCEAPMRAWAISVGSRGSELDCRFEATREPYLYPALDIAADEPGSEFDLYRHFVGAGRMSVDGAPAELLSVRDRTWGVRSRRARLHNWYVIHLGSHFLTLIHQERADGSVLFSAAALSGPEGEAERLAVTGHDLGFHPSDRQVERGKVTLTGAERVLELELSRVGQAIRLAGAGYDSRQGARSESAGIERDSYDLGAEVEAARLGRGTMDVPVEAKLSGPGIQLSGVGIAETAVARDHRRYGSRLV